VHDLESTVCLRPSSMHCRVQPPQRVSAAAQRSWRRNSSAAFGKSGNVKAHSADSPDECVCLQAKVVSRCCVFRSKGGYVLSWLGLCAVRRIGIGTSRTQSGKLGFENAPLNISCDRNHHGDSRTRHPSDAGALQSRSRGSQAQGRGVPLKRHWKEVMTQVVTQIIVD